MSPIPMRTAEEVERAFGLIFIAEEMLKQADWQAAAASWRSQIETAALFDPTLFIRATTGQTGGDMALKIKLAEAAAAFLAVLATARESAADMVADFGARRARADRERLDGRAA